MAPRHRPTLRAAEVRTRIEHRLGEANANRARWRLWGPYLAERQWGTVREDYSAEGEPWAYFPHDHARSRAYRWGEDGLLGISDDRGILHFCLALWNEADPILKERLFGLTGREGNHGEDVKECYFYLDATPSQCWLQALYKYPQRAFPYRELLERNGALTRDEPEFELVDTGVFEGDRYFDILVEYAKAAPEDVVIRLTATNRGPGPAPLHVLPTLWFRNTWSWGRDERRPEIHALPTTGQVGVRSVEANHHRLGTYFLACAGRPRLLFTENDTNFERLYGVPNRSPFVKDGIGDAVVDGHAESLNPDQRGTKMAAHYKAVIGSGKSLELLLRLSRERLPDPFGDAQATLAERRADADAFFRKLGNGLAEEAARIQRQALAGLIWTKQYYHFNVEQWLGGDPPGPAPPPARRLGRNSSWRQFDAAEVISMPDTWEYPWFAAWDLAFHSVALALLDPGFAKEQLILLTREWYMHPNGQLPAYEWSFDDVNPPVHAWAVWRVYKIDRRVRGKADRAFLERAFHKLLLNFTWWVNRKDADGHNVFQGGFLGLDNIGVFDRSRPLPTGGHLGQADGTAWMGMFCLTMLAIALELARENRAYEDVATKFFEHFLYIAAALNNLGGMGIPLWNEEDEFFYDVLHLPDGGAIPLRVRSMVGLIPLLAVETIEPDLLENLPAFRARMNWFLTHRPDLAALVSRWHEPGMGQRRLLALVRGHRMKRLLGRMLDPAEFLSEHGVRSLSRYHRDEPFTLEIDGTAHSVQYEPAESRTATFGGNSNWRGPVWFPVNFLIIEAVQRFHHYYGDEFRVECPTGSGRLVSLLEVADELSRRLTSLFYPGADRSRPIFGGDRRYADDPAWRNLLLFHEYFDGDTGAGLGASHQTGWTALVAKLLQQTRGRQTAHS